MGKCNQIRQIVRLRQMLRRWRKLATSSLHTRLTPPDVPAGHVVLTVGNARTRFIMRATYLNHPVFKTLLAQAEEEYGFVNQGPLSIPCEESAFLEILRVLTRTESSNSGRLGVRKSRDIWCESRPLLLG